MLYGREIMVLCASYLACIGSVYGVQHPIEELDPPDSVSVRATLSKGEFVLGEPICVEVVIANKGTGILEVGDPSGSSFKASFQDGSAASGTRGGNSLRVGLRPVVPVEAGQSRTFRFFVESCLKMPTHGELTIAFETAFFIREIPSSGEPGPIRQVGVSSLLKPRVRPGSPSLLSEVMASYARQLHDPDGKMQSQAANALAAADPCVAVPLLRAALQDKQERHLGYVPCVMRALGKIGTDQAIRELSDTALHDDDSAVCLTAIRELGAPRRTAGLPALVELLGSPQAQVRLAAVRSVGLIGDPSAIGAVEARLNDPNEQVRTEASRVSDRLKKVRSDAVDRIN